MQVTVWANDLHAMNPLQRILAKKFIGDVLFEGIVETIETMCSLIPLYMYHLNDYPKSQSYLRYSFLSCGLLS